MTQFYPEGKLKILTGVPWSNDYRDTRYFQTLDEQLSYFNSKTVLYETDSASYIRQELAFVSVDENIENLWNSDYVMFQNQNMGDKWFFAFVTRLEMKAANTTWVYFEIDVMQTWMFDLSPIQAYIERKHFGIETATTVYEAEESIGTGESYITTKTMVVDHTTSGVVLLTSLVDISESGGTFEEPKIVGATGGVVHNLPTGCDYYLVGEKYGCTIYEFFQEIQNYPWISRGIIGVTIIPEFMLDGVSVSTVSVGGSTLTVGKLSDDSDPAMRNVISLDVLGNLPDMGYQKLKMYPFSYVEFSLYNGSTIIVKPQYTSNGNLNVYRKGVISQSPEVKYWFTNYEVNGQGYDYSLSQKDFPQCPVQDSSYLLTMDRTRRMAEMNGDNLIANSLLTGIGQALSFNLGGLVNTAVGSVQQAKKIALDLKYADTMSPSLATNSGGSTFAYATGEMGLHIRFRTVDRTHRKIIGDYFKLFGYACKEVEVVSPDRMSRFDYVETRDCHITGSAPNDHIKKMEAIYDNGIRFWHDDSIGNYDNNVGVKN